MFTSHAWGGLSFICPQGHIIRGKVPNILRKLPLPSPDTHPLHQETGIHVLGKAGTKAIGEGEFIATDVSLEAEVAYMGRMMLGQCTQKEVVGGNDTIGLQANELFQQSK